MILSVAQHASPAWLRWLNTEPKKTKRGFSQDDAGKSKTGLDDQSGQQIRQNMIDQDPGARCTDADGRADKSQFTKL